MTITTLAAITPVRRLAAAIHVDCVKRWGDIDSGRVDAYRWVTRWNREVPRHMVAAHDDEAHSILTADPSLVVTDRDSLTRALTAIHGGPAPWPKQRTSEQMADEIIARLREVTK